MRSNETAYTADSQLVRKYLQKNKKKVKKVLAYLSYLCYTRQVRNRDINKAPWSSGQDASLSRWNQGFDSPRSH